MSRALAAYRVIAWVVGVWLLVLVVAVIAKYGPWHSGTLVQVVGPIHGFFYMAYFAITLWLWSTVGWSFVRALGIALAGTVPFLSFVAERSVTRDVRARLAAATAGTSTDEGRIGR